VKTARPSNHGATFFQVLSVMVATPADLYCDRSPCVSILFSLSDSTPNADVDGSVTNLRLRNLIALLTSSSLCATPEHSLLGVHLSKQR
jgi:hypothetical protein